MSNRCESEPFCDRTRDELDELRARTSWQPIETAPKDGTPVLLAGGQDCEAEYGRDERETAIMKTPCRAWWSSQGWIITVTEAGYCCVTRDNPTHWMPLHDPPEK